MPCEFTVTRRVEFSETDMAGIVHYSNFFKYMETAEHGFYRSLGYSVVMGDMDPPIGWPRVHAECDFTKPLRFEDEVSIRLLVEKVGSSSLSFQFRFARLNPAPQEEIGRGRLTVVCVTRTSEGGLKAVPIPAGLREKLEVAPAGLLG
ncbi:MAG: acyl-CoA thioesterase [Verrucomicrobia bacterium]|nr:acyl-CoA thioesterase [Verrucomicrobiota bacterium]